MKGLPAKYSTFCAVMTQKDTDSCFLEFKTALKSFEENEKHREAPDNNVNERVMKFQQFNRSVRPPSKVTCYRCGKLGYKSFVCSVSAGNRYGNSGSSDDPRNNFRNKWCSKCRSSTHTDQECRRPADSAQTVV